MRTGPALRVRVVTLSTLLLLGSCASIAQKGALIGVRKAVNKQDYAACLENLSEAESYGDFSEQENAQISFYRGFCLEGLGRQPEAAAVYQRLIEKYPDTDWAAQARGRASALR